jgi:hypothetical protein
MTQIESVARRLISGGKQGLGSPVPPALDFLGALAHDQVLGAKALRSAAGCRFNAVNGNGSTFLAPVTAWPTTALTMMLWNGEADGGKTYFIDQLYAFLASGTPDVGGALLACVTLGKQAINPAAYANTVISGLSGKLGASSKAVFANAITAVGGTPAWMVVDCSPMGTATAKIAANAFLAEINGGIAVPPGYGLGLTMLAGAGTTPLFGFGATWDEVQADLE